ncbi:four-carbon acid sugar kinase family protein [Shinella sp.]|uniref:four-carbon acid sugar kinase family protein n=1 Tax=Shinella sp. TaxID=1870904 RepID=UPI003F70352A
MTEFAIIADDLTGALDSVAPFAKRGMSVLVAATADKVVEALQLGPAVIAVNTASRELPEPGLDDIAWCSRLFSQAGAVQMKKVDSRLKGHVAAEVACMMETLSCSRLLVVPAIPGLGRLVSDGNVVGAGISAPISIAERLGDLAHRAVIPDCGDAEAMKAVIRSHLVDPDGTLLVGAGGASLALAELAAPEGAAECVPFQPLFPMLFVIGSRDPITLAQVEHLRKSHPDAAVLLATAGADALSPQDVSRRLADRAADMIRRGGVRTVVASGGESAQALLKALGVALLQPRGEVFQGVPWSTIETADGTPLIFISKSGGFGNVDALTSIHRAAR